MPFRAKGAVLLAISSRELGGPTSQSQWGLIRLTRRLLVTGPAPFLMHALEITQRPMLKENHFIPLL